MIELRDRKLTSCRPECRTERKQRRGDVRRVRGCALVVAEDRVLALRAVSREARLAAVQPAIEAEPPVPAARRLQEVAADRPHRAELWRSCLRARLPQRLRDFAIQFELCQCRPRADAGARDPARDDVANLNQRVGLDQAVPYERNELGPTREGA